MFGETTMEALAGPYNDLRNCDMPMTAKRIPLSEAVRKVHDLVYASIGTLEDIMISCFGGEKINRTNMQTANCLSEECSYLLEDAEQMLKMVNDLHEALF